MEKIPPRLISLDSLKLALMLVSTANSRPPEVGNVATPLPVGLVG